MRTIGTFLIFVLFAMSCPGQEMTILQGYQSILARSPEDASLKSLVDGLRSKLDTVRTMPVAEIDAIIPSALQCARSTNALVLDAGMVFFVEVMARYDSATVLEPYIDDLGNLADEKDSPQRKGILPILGGLNPKPPDKAIAYLEATLGSSSSEEAPAIAASLLKAARTNPLRPAPADSPIVHKVIAFTTTRADADLTSNVLRAIGVDQIRVPEAINFLSVNLNESNPRLRAAAVEGASRLDKDTRAQLSGQLNRIASDPKEDKEVRTQAAQALKP